MLVLGILIILSLILFVTITTLNNRRILLSNIKNCEAFTSNRRICLIIAHPDDECMFFAPILRQLSARNKFHILCITNGDFYGKGTVRSKELYQSCSELIQKENLVDIQILNEPEKLPDSPNIAWDLNLCRKLILNYINNNSIDFIITFDENGVSGHANHCAISNLISDMRSKNELQSIDIFKLRTLNVFRKYLFVLDLIPSLIDLCLIKAISENTYLMALNSFSDYACSFKAMLKHRSQLMWFRWLYLISSRYMFINDLQRI
jgi:N-acetylglucosaminylphosphatidylinositol deacetylase